MKLVGFATFWITCGLPVCAQGSGSDASSPLSEPGIGLHVGLFNAQGDDRWRGAGGIHYRTGIHELVQADFSLGWSACTVMDGEASVDQYSLDVAANLHLASFTSEETWDGYLIYGFGFCDARARFRGSMASLGTEGGFVFRSEMGLGAQVRAGGQCALWAELRYFTYKETAAELNIDHDELTTWQLNFGVNVRL